MDDSSQKPDIHNEPSSMIDELFSNVYLKKQIITLHLRSCF